MSNLKNKALAGAEAGFTLIELMIVIAIIGILAAIAIPQYEKYIATSKGTAVASNLKQAVDAANAAFAASNAGQTTDLTTVLNFATSNDPASPNLSAYTTGTPTCGQVSITPTTISSANSQSGVTVQVGLGCTNADINTAISSALTAAGFSAFASGTAVTVSGY